MAKERLRKKLKKLERVPPELIPIEDFITSVKCLDETRYNSFFVCVLTRSDLFLGIVKPPAVLDGWAHT